jgi:hypothetical protein
MPLELALSEPLSVHLSSVLPMELALSEPLSVHLSSVLPLELALSEPSWIGFVWVGVVWIGLSCVELDWIGLRLVGLDGMVWNRIGMGWIGFSLIGLDCIWLDWIVLDWLGPIRIHVKTMALRITQKQNRGNEIRQINIIFARCPQTKKSAELTIKGKGHTAFGWPLSFLLRDAQANLAQQNVAASTSHT